MIYFSISEMTCVADSHAISASFEGFAANKQGIDG